MVRRLTASCDRLPLLIAAVVATPRWHGVRRCPVLELWGRWVRRVPRSTCCANGSYKVHRHDGYLLGSCHAPVASAECRVRAGKEPLAVVAGADDQLVPVAQSKAGRQPCGRCGCCQSAGVGMYWVASSSSFVEKSYRLGNEWGSECPRPSRLPCRVQCRLQTAPARYALRW
jgi:hypothetical protein